MENRRENGGALGSTCTTLLSSGSVPESGVKLCSGVEYTRPLLKGASVSGSAERSFGESVISTISIGGSFNAIAGSNGCGGVVGGSSSKVLESRY